MRRTFLPAMPLKELRPTSSGLIRFYLKTVRGWQLVVWHVRERMTVWRRPAPLTRPLQAPIRNRPHRAPKAAKHITGVRRSQLPHGTARWDFSSTCQPSCLNFITCTHELEVTRLYCEICHPAREQGCCHSTSPELRWCSKKKKILTLFANTQNCWRMWRSLSDNRFGLCEVQRYISPPVLHYASSLFHNSPFHLVPLLAQ